MVEFPGCYNVLIASSSDTKVERECVFDTISEWNGGWSGAPRNVIFVPLMWERHGVPDADANGIQDAINRQLLDRSDFVIAFFKRRIGTRTQHYPGGTIEELAKRHGRAAVFFCSPNGANKGKYTSQWNALAAFRKNFKGSYGEYKDPEDLSGQVRKTLESWAADLTGKQPQTLLAMYRNQWKPEYITKYIDGASRNVSLLIYNTELQEFRSKNDFEDTWSCLSGCRSIGSVVFLLPTYKIDRLREYLHKISGAKSVRLLKRFFVCQMLEASEHEKLPSRLTSSLAFALVRFGKDPGYGEFLPVADLMLLCEPFSSAGSSERGTPDLQWTHKYFVETRDEKLRPSLCELWQSHFSCERTVPITTLIRPRPKKSEVEKWVESHIVSDLDIQEDKTVVLVKQLREKLFDPNVPSYLLNTNYRMLDWNPAFELIFPTHKFYRNENVREFINVLDNREDVKRRGADSFGGHVPDFDLEPIIFTSPVYGRMVFTKMASKVSDPLSQETCGWIVALNVNSVQNWNVYESDLQKINEKHALLGLYTKACDRVLSHFPGHDALVRAHADAMQSCNKILVLGGGLGFLAFELLRRGKEVTVVETNDAMLERLRRRCRDLSRISILKTNIEALHKPNNDYDRGKIGLRPPYDGACLNNTYQWLGDPPALLKRLVSEGLLAKGATVTLSFLTSDEMKEQLDALNQLGYHDWWKPEDYERYSAVVTRIIGLKVIDKYCAKDIEKHLHDARYESVKFGRAEYTIDGRQHDGPPFFIAKAPPANP